ncbi:ABC transporter permease [Halostagnicola sp. A-GB9-2]|uniref:ABC transporter permease n=1 Tax=Halostagnicola sp. A-GB9-2 TaxID=3048066 RepID=UPI0024BF42F3|nr:ABC transporter permease [Halostagnicola sp. A-GB9-2]MDJ1433757.1 ABC transporter permease [Halostagnicola sp. A-GB9-2]
MGIFIAYYQPASLSVLWGAGVAMTIPSLALFGLLVPFLGIGNPPVIVALVLYAQLPIIRNTYIGLTGVEKDMIEAGEGVGMTRWQRLRQIQIPVALPVITAGVRNATVILIGVATVGAYVGAGGLGDYIFTGIYQANTEMIVVATVVVSLLALVFDYGLKIIEQFLQLQNGEDVALTRGTKAITKVIT